MEKAQGICSASIARVSFIWRWPGRFPPVMLAGGLVESVDFAATVYALAGVDAWRSATARPGPFCCAARAAPCAASR